MTKIAVVTTFPNGYPTAEKMLLSFDTHWPKEIDLFIGLDEMDDQTFLQAREQFGHFLPERNVMLNATYSDLRKKFLQEHTDDKENYRFQVCRFSHKVFTLYNVYAQQKDNYDYLIWLDADVITKEQIPFDVILRDFLPKDEAVSYLGRSVAPHSECGFVGYNTKFDVIEKMHQMYITDEILTLSGFTDCDVFDHVIKDYESLNLSKDVTIDRKTGSDGWNVWPFTVLGKYMEHYKGNRKYSAYRTPAVMPDDLKVKTQNCLPVEEIRENIRQNLLQIKEWVTYCKPHSESVVIASAGESLSYADLKPWHDKGVKIVCVKHAIERLKKWKIKPWACVLLDPRQHVEKFVSAPDKDVIYFVASMVAPSVVAALLENGCRVIGYHAFVGAGEEKIIAEHDPKAMLISGGSATATRSIGLLYECLGFQDIHCYGYDLCHFTRPDMSELLPDGNPKYMEVVLGAHGWNNEPKQRLFWTEGQFLAQAQEMRDLYKMKKDFNMTVYGYGLAAWWYDAYKEQQAWIESINEQVVERKQNGRELNEWLSRG